MSAVRFVETGSIFAFLRSSVDESIPLVRILNPHFNEWHESIDDIFRTWHDIAHFSIEYLLDLSHSEPISSSTLGHTSNSNHIGQSPILRSLPTDLASCNSISEMIPLIFKMYSIECLLYKNVNRFLRCFPIAIVSKFMKELGGIIRYIYLLQSSIEYCSHAKSLSSEMIVYRGIQHDVQILVPLYESMIGEMIVWPSFTSTSSERELVISNFITSEDSLLFEILLHPGDVAVPIADYSDHEYESEILIAASSGFTIDDVEWVEIRGLKIAQVRLSYCMSWYDFNIDDPPDPILI
jgi:hypothetical protein